MRKRYFGLIGALIVLLVATFLPGVTLIAPPSASAKTVSVSIIDTAFSSADITVNVGDTVKWTNTGAVPHTVTSTSSGPLDSGQLAPGATYQFTFTEVGTYNYKCLNHVTMTGVIRVVSGGPTPTKTATPIAPSITLDKEKSKYNGGVKATLAGFTPGKAITVTWPDGIKLLQLTASTSGKASGTFRTPLSPLGNYKVTAKDANGKTASTTLRVIPRIMLAPADEGPVGTVFRVYFYGFSPGDVVKIRWYAPDGVSFQVLATVEIADNGRASKLVTVPTGSALGGHKISGNVVGISRSAPTTFTVTASGASSAEDATASPTQSPSPTTTEPSPPTETSIPTATDIPTATETPAPVETETPIPTPTVDPASPVPLVDGDE
jgi:plastocyanin